MNYYSKRIILSISCILLIFSVNAQNGIKLAERYAKVFDFKNAIDQYKKVINKDSENVSATRGLASAYRHIGEYSDSEYWYGKLVKLDSENPENRFYYSQALRSTKKYDKALESWELYMKATNKNYVSGIINGFDYVNSLSKPNPNLIVKNAKNLNTKASDFGISFKNMSEVTFVSTRDNSIGMKDNWTHEKYTDIYTSTVDFDEQSTPTKFRNDQYNGMYHDGPCTFYENTMYLSRSQYKNATAYKSKEDQTVKLELVTVDLNETSSKLKKYAKDFDFNNIEYSVSHAAVSKDGNTIIFSSDSKVFGEYFGGTDLYKTTKTDGVWSAPVNLGGSINTPADEEYPFYSADNQIYFASNGHYGLGGLDIYTSTLNNSKWSSPENIGAPINSSFDDFNYIFSSENELGFFSSNRTGGLGSDDIYTFKYVDGAKKPGDNISLKILAYDAETLEPLEAVTIDITKCLEDKLYTDGKGKVISPIEEYISCKLNASLEGYFPKDLPFSVFDQDVELKVPLRKKNLNNLIQIEACVYDRRTNLPIEGADIRIENATTGDFLVTKTGPDGCLLFAGIEADYCYNLIGAKQVGAAEETYLATSDQVCTFGATAPMIFQKSLYLDFVKVKEPMIGSLERSVLPNGIVLPIIYYNLDKFDIRRDAVKELNYLIKVMRDNPTLQIEAASHTDCRRDVAYNMNLSKNRAIEVVDYLVERGISRSRLSWGNYGESQHVNDCDCECDLPIEQIGLQKFRDCEDRMLNGCSEYDHQQNRRTEFVVVKF